jgi:hypothetical protein
MRLLIALATCVLLVNCASPEPQLQPEKAPDTLRRADSAVVAPQALSRPEVPSSAQDSLPSGYSLTDTTGWADMFEEGQRAILRRAAVGIDTVDLGFGVNLVGTDSLVFLAVRTDSAPLTTCSPPCYESWPTEYVFWTPESRRELRNLLPFFSAFSSSPQMAGESLIYYWGLAPHDRTNRLYAMRYDFRTARADSTSLNRDDPIATDYRYHLPTPQIHGSDVSFGDVVLDGTTWQIIRKQPPTN